MGGFETLTLWERPRNPFAKDTRGSWRPGNPRRPLAEAVLTFAGRGASREKGFGGRCGLRQLPGLPCSPQLPVGLGVLSPGLTQFRVSG